MASTFAKVVTTRQNAGLASSKFLASGKFMNGLRRPQRTPIPIISPAHNVEQTLNTPPDASCFERFRDSTLRFFAHPVFSVLAVIWAVAVTVVFTAFALCLFHLLPLPNDEQDYYQERSTQGLSALFTYSVIIPLPWRLSILWQVLNRECRDHPGTDLHLRPTDVAFFNIGWRERAIIAVLLMLNTIIQLVHQAFHIVWHDFGSFSSFPHSLYFTVTMITSFLCGAIAGVYQFWQEHRLRQAEPDRFPPGPEELLQEMRRRNAEGESYADLLQELRDAAAKEEAEVGGSLGSAGVVVVGVAATAAVTAATAAITPSEQTPLMGK